MEGIKKAFKFLNPEFKLRFIFRSIVTIMLHLTIDRIHDESTKYKIVIKFIKCYDAYLKFKQLFGVTYDITVANKLINHIRDKKVVSSGEPCELYSIGNAPIYNINPTISIIIPTRNQSEMLNRCVSSIITQSAYDNYEIVVVDNNSDEDLHLDTYKNVRIISYAHEYNFAKIYNYAISQVTSEYIIMLNNDTEVIEPTWIEQMIGPMVNDRTIGVVGAKLLFPDNRIQHAGVSFDSLTGFFTHIYSGTCDCNELTNTLMFYKSVTGACLAISSELYMFVGGMDYNLRVAYNDTDLCMKVGKSNHKVLYTPFAKLYHYESATRGSDECLEQKLLQTFEQLYFLQLVKHNEYIII